MSGNRAGVVLLTAAGMFLFTMLGFAVGVGSAHFRLWPYEQFRLAAIAGKTFFETGDFWSFRFRKAAPPGRPDEEFHLRSPGVLLPGYYVFMGFEKAVNSYSVRMFNETGDLISRILVSPSKFGIEPEPNFPDPHGLQLLPDGSMIMTYDRADMLVKLDRCGEPQWIREDSYHHLATRTGRDTIMVWRGVPNAYGAHQFIEEVSEDTGETLRSIAIEDVIRQAGPMAAYFNTDHKAPFPDPAIIGMPDRSSIDRYHPNDVEELSAADAAAFPLFEAGDLLISLKTVNIVAVVDPLTLELKWFDRGPWTKQHDPDFLPDGRISVFDNNVQYPTSRIVIIDPVTGELETRFAGPEAGDGDFFFSTGAQGNHQRLPNGHYLIVSTHQGFAAVLDDTNVPVLEFNNFFDAEEPFNGHLVYAEWLPEDFFAVSPVCETAVAQ